MDATPRVEVTMRLSEKSGQALMAADSKLHWLSRRPPLSPAEYLAELYQVVRWVGEAIGEAAAVAPPAP